MTVLWRVFENHLYFDKQIFFLFLRSQISRESHCERVSSSGYDSKERSRGQVSRREWTGYLTDKLAGSWTEGLMAGYIAPFTVNIVRCRSFRSRMTAWEDGPKLQSMFLYWWHRECRCDMMEWKDTTKACPAFVLQCGQWRLVGQEGENSGAEMM